MNTFGDVLNLLAAAPAIILLILAGMVLVLASDWRLILTALLVEYSISALILTYYIRPEQALLRIVVGALVVPILYLTARRIADLAPRLHAGPGNGSIPDALPASESLAGGAGERAARAWGRWLRQIDWAAGPLGASVRLLAVVLVGAAIVHIFYTYPPSGASPDLGEIFANLLDPEYRINQSSGVSPALAPDLAFATYWLIGMGLLGLLLSEQPLRAGPALLTILAGFDLTFAILERSLAVFGFYGSLSLLVALSISYLAAVRGLAVIGEEEEPA